MDDDETCQDRETEATFFDWRKHHSEADTIWCISQLGERQKGMVLWKGICKMTAGHGLPWSPTTDRDANQETWLMHYDDIPCRQHRKAIRPMRLDCSSGLVVSR